MQYKAKKELSEAKSASGSLTHAVVRGEGHAVGLAAADQGLLFNSLAYSFLIVGGWNFLLVFQPSYTLELGEISSRHHGMILLCHQGIWHHDLRDLVKMCATALCIFEPCLK